MSAVITVQHVKKIIRKLKARESDRKSKHHRHYDVIHKGRVVITFGVSHTPQKGQPQSHLPEQLMLNFFDTKQLAECTLSRDGYIAELRNQGAI